MSVPVAEQETHTHTHEREVFSQTFGIMSDRERERERVRKGLKVGLPISGRAVAPLFLLLWLRESWRNFRRPFSLSLSLSPLQHRKQSETFLGEKEKEGERKTKKREEWSSLSPTSLITHTCSAAVSTHMARKPISGGKMPNIQRVQLM